MNPRKVTDAGRPRGVPSVSYSITVRLEVPAGGRAVSLLTTAVEHAGGVVTALDVTASGHERLRIDVTCAARDTEHADQLVAAMQQVEGVVIGKVSDRTFLMHLGGKIEMHAKHPIHNRDDLSMIYTRGGPGLSGHREEPRGRPPTDGETQQRRGSHRRVGRTGFGQHRPERRCR